MGSTLATKEGNHIVDSHHVSFEDFMKSSKKGGTSSFKPQSRATRNSHQLPANNKLRPAKHKRNDSDYY